jgi:hypothetical protein
MPSVYLETTIPSYLTAWPSHNLVMAAHQAITREWWETQLRRFELFASQLVIEEASAGDETASALRLTALDQITVLASTSTVEWIAVELARLALVPPNAAADAFHIGYASAYVMDYLLTWNCRHIVNAERWPEITNFLRRSGLHVPVACTPEELMGDLDETDDTI